MNPHRHQLFQNKLLQKGFVPFASVFFALFSGLLLGGSARGQGGAWRDVTGSVGGPKWGYAGVTLLASVPKRDELLAGVSGAGIWSSRDGGTTWRLLGQDGQITCRPYQILFDPKQPETFWVSGNYGPGLFKTTDGGQTFQRLGSVEHCDGVGVDLTDEYRRTVVIGAHEQSNKVHLSMSSGLSWNNIGLTLPGGSSFSSDIVVLGESLYLTSGRSVNAPLAGIYRTTDGGKRWTRVSEGTARGAALVTSAGTIYWATWNRGVLRSEDKGATWKQAAGMSLYSLSEGPGGSLVGIGDGQRLYLSKDGATWTPIGPKIPFVATGMIYHPGRSAYYCWRMTDKREPNAIVMWKP